MLAECIENLRIKEDGVYVDATLGGGGHSLQICRRLGSGGTLIAIDQDLEAVYRGMRTLSGYVDRVTIVKENFSKINSILDRLEVNKVDGFILDLGVSSFQLDEPSRGFSYMRAGPLDMRMNKEGRRTAYDIVNTYGEDELCRVIGEYGEENWARRISKFICEARSVKPISDTAELVAVIKRAVPRAAREERQHPAKRTFQAIRIELNQELSILEDALRDMVERLERGGRICVISFHSKEDRIVKSTFKNLETGCECPRDFPVCVCGREPSVRIINKKPILPSAVELENNSRSRSAKLRVAEKI
jgi:16S rRNA (cytosine1402-N4)-methyltransferase